MDPQKNINTTLLILGFLHVVSDITTFYGNNARYIFLENIASSFLIFVCILLIAPETLIAADLILMFASLILVISFGRYIVDRLAGNLE